MKRPDLVFMTPHNAHRFELKEKEECQTTQPTS